MFIVFSDMHLAVERTDGKRNFPFPEIVWSSRKIATARGASGTRSGRFIFIFSPGIVGGGLNPRLNGAGRLIE